MQIFMLFILLLSVFKQPGWNILFIAVLLMAVWKLVSYKSSPLSYLKLIFAGILGLFGGSCLTVISWLIIPMPTEMGKFVNLFAIFMLLGYSMSLFYVVKIEKNALKKAKSIEVNRTKIGIICLNTLINLVILYIAIKRYSYQPLMDNRNILIYSLAIVLNIYYSSIYLNIISHANRIYLKGLLIGMLIGSIEMIICWTLIYSPLSEEGIPGGDFAPYIAMVIALEVALWPIIGYVINRKEISAPST